MSLSWLFFGGAVSSGGGGGGGRTGAGSVVGSVVGVVEPGSVGIVVESDGGVITPWSGAVVVVVGVVSGGVVVVVVSSGVVSVVVVCANAKLTTPSDSVTARVAATKPASSRDTLREHVFTRHRSAAPPHTSPNPPDAGLLILR